jgi:hypothetical protein
MGPLLSTLYTNSTGSPCLIHVGTEGNPYLSWAFSEAAHFAVRHHEPAKKFVQRKRAKTNGIVAIRALAHKLARASYYVMKDNVDFDPDKMLH